MLGLGSDGTTVRSRVLPVPELRPGRAQAPRNHQRAGDAGRRRAQRISSSSIVSPCLSRCAAYSATASGPTARKDPAHDQVVTGIAARLAGLSRCAVMLAEDETHLNLPHVRASRTARPTSGVLAPATNRKVTVLGWSR